MGSSFKLSKALTAILAVSLAVIFSLPSLYDSVPVVQLKSKRDSPLSSLLPQINAMELSHERIETSKDFIQLYFNDNESQLKARAKLQQRFGKDFSVALNSASTTPDWLSAIGAKPINLGLDLQGGVYFLLEINHLFAINKKLTSYQSDITSILRELNIRKFNITIEEGILQLSVLQSELGRAELTEQLQTTTQDLELINPQTTSLVFKYQLNEDEISQLIDLSITQNIETLRRRIDEIGVAEPIITRQGKDRISVQLPGIQDIAGAKQIIGRTASLELRPVDERRTDSANILANAQNRSLPSNRELLALSDGGFIITEKRTIITGEHISDAQPSLDRNNQPAVYLELNSNGANLMKRYTRSAVGKRMAIVLIDNDSSEAISAPVIQEELFANFIIHGSMSPAEASELSLLLRSGALAAPLSIIEERAVGPSLGADNIRFGITSLIGGFIAVAIFIAAYYSIFGIFSVLALIANLALLTTMLSILGATLTLPGLAAFALTLGMAIDSNVLINERIREEQAEGKDARSAIKIGYQRALTTILDANLTTLIAGIALFIFGTGPVRGFAVVLCFGLLTSMFSALYISRTFVYFAYERKQIRTFSLKTGWRAINPKRVFKIIEKIKIPIILSAIMVSASIGSLAYKGLNLGVDFTGGQLLEIEFAGSGELQIDQVRSSIEKLELGEVPLQLISARQIFMKIGSQHADNQTSELVLKALTDAGFEPQLRGSEFVGPQVSEQLFIAGALALLFVFLGICAYLALRFKWRMSVGAIVANSHDVIIILGLFSLFEWEFTLPVLAAVLAILGYSVNESVIIFDRIREICKSERKLPPIGQIINMAITQTWARTIITHGSTQLAILTMLFFGGPSLFYFALALTIGIFASIYSSILIAGPLAKRLGMQPADFIFVKRRADDETAGAVV